MTPFAKALAAAAPLLLLCACDQLFPYGAATFDAAAPDGGLADRALPEAGREAGSEAWWDPAWPLRKQLVAAPAGSAEDLAGFPLLVSLERDDELAAHAPTARALRFVSTDGQLLAHDVERYEPGNGALTAWVRLPALHAGAATPLYLYFGGPDVASPLPAADVWDGYRVVLHFGEAADPATRARNAASPDAYAVVNGATADPAGKIAGAMTFSRETDQVLPAGNAPLIDGWSTLYVALWLRVDYASDAEWAASGEGKLIEQWGMIQAGRTYPLGAPGEGVFQIDVQLRDSGYFFLQGGLRRQRWEHVALTYDGQRLALYVNGRAAHVEHAPGDRFGPGEHSLTLGYTAFDWTSFRGALDEVRVGVAPHSAEWIAAEHANQAGPAAFVTVGPVEMLRR